MARPNPRHLALSLLLTTLTPAQTPKVHTSRPTLTQKNAPKADTEWEQQQERFRAIGTPGEEALQREHAQTDRHACPTDWDFKDPKAVCYTAETHKTEANYLIFKLSLDKMLRLNDHAYPDLPLSQELPFDTGEKAWMAARDAMCAARANPRPSPNTAGSSFMQQACLLSLTRKHMDDLASLYFLLREGSY